MGEAKLDRFRVVVGVDFSDGSRHAIHEAMHLARMMPRVEVHFANVMEVSPDLHDARLIDELSDSLGQGMAKLERFVRDVLYVYGSGAGWGLELAYHVRVGPVARELHQVAVDVDAELLIIGEHRAGVMRNLLRRSAFEELVRTAHVPVVVAHPKDFRGFEKSAAPEPPRPGQDLSRSGTFATVEQYDSDRNVHISGLI